MSVFLQRQDFSLAKSGVLDCKTSRIYKCLRPVRVCNNICLPLIEAHLDKDLTISKFFPSLTVYIKSNKSLFD